MGSTCRARRRPEHKSAGLGCEESFADDEPQCRRDSWMVPNQSSSFALIVDALTWRLGSSSSRRKMHPRTSVVSVVEHQCAVVVAAAAVEAGCNEMSSDESPPFEMRLYMGVSYCPRHCL